MKRTTGWGRGVALGQDASCASFSRIDTRETGGAGDDSDAEAT
ncbi:MULTISPECIES: hypothetical protein [Corallococcus]|nr:MULTISPECIES: hypothetical protein [Corallococcus]